MTKNIIKKRIQFPVNKGMTKTASKEDELAKVKLIQASYELPTVKVDNEKAINDFLNDDGGYW